jgi:hypothetical protein
MTQPLEHLTPDNRSADAGGDRHDAARHEVNSTSLDSAAKIYAAVRLAAQVASEAILPSLSLNGADHSSKGLYNVLASEAATLTTLATPPGEVNPFAADHAKAKEREQIVSFFTPEQKKQYQHEEEQFKSWSLGTGLGVIEPPAMPLHEAIQRKTNANGMTDWENASGALTKKGAAVAPDLLKHVADS